MMKIILVIKQDINSVVLRVLQRPQMQEATNKFTALKKKPLANDEVRQVQQEKTPLVGYKKHKHTALDIQRDSTMTTEHYTI